MKEIKRLCHAACAVAMAGTAWAQQPETIEWSASRVPADYRITGNPQLVRTPLGPAVGFDGASDAVFIDSNPLRGMDQLTIEVIFKPDGDGKFAQRFMHLGEVFGERIMLETRVNPDGTWYFDAHTQLPDEGPYLTLIDETLLHPTDRWYSVALVITTTMQTSYVNGTPQKWGYLNYVPIDKGVSSVGVRQNLVDYFKGTIYRVRITPRALLPHEFLNDYQELNK